MGPFYTLYTLLHLLPLVRGMISVRRAVCF